MNMKNGKKKLTFYVLDNFIMIFIIDICPIYLKDNKKSYTEANLKLNLFSYWLKP